MSWLAKFADRVVLCPSKHPIDPEDRQRRLIPFADGHLEAWTTSVHQDENATTKLEAIKFPGNAGRAERGSAHPCELWPNVASEIWTINPAGYGGSDGTASLQKIARDCEAVFSFVADQFPDQKRLLIGNSLGCLSVFYLAARHDVDAIYLRNPPPLKQLIAQRPRYNWWNFGIARYVAKTIPDELDVLENAAQVKCPAFFLRSEKDTIVPLKYQQMILDAYAGPISDFVIQGAEHHDLVGETQRDAYRLAVEDFGLQICSPDSDDRT